MKFIDYLLILLILFLVLLILDMNSTKEFFDASWCKNDQLTAADITSDRFKIQYRIEGYCTEEIVNSVKQAVNKLENIITRSVGNNREFNDNRVPVTYNGKRFVKDIYIIFKINDQNIREESGAISEDTVGGSSILEDRTLQKDGQFMVYPVLGEIQLLKSTIVEDLKYFYDETKYPQSKGKNRFYYLVLHEMLHILGVGPLWTYPDYDASATPSSYDRYWIDTTRYLFIGPKNPKYGGLSATTYYYNQLTGKPAGTYKSTPIENNGEEGTILYHWEQGLYNDGNSVISRNDRVVDNISAPGLNNELMVGWGIDNVAPALSKITIGNLEDLGYTVDYSQADPFSIGGNGGVQTTTATTSPTTATSETTSVSTSTTNELATTPTTTSASTAGTDIVYEDAPTNNDYENGDYEYVDEVIEEDVPQTNRNSEYMKSNSKPKSLMFALNPINHCTIL